MDIVFHYPPELFELLVQTIPLLCRTKDAVLVFFQGAGVEARHLKDLQIRVVQDRKGITKYEITREVLTILNKLGEQTLRERREVLKRVTEFEDFSTCWPDDQLKAKGLVAEIRRVVDVKDSFTRMRQEVEREQQKHQAQQRERLRAVEQQRNERDSIKRELYSLFNLPPNESQKRGKLLEGILNRLFHLEGILVREAFEVKKQGHGVIEQIDGVVEIDNSLYLVEMKWWKDPLGKTDVSPHLVGVYSRGHAGGIFISASGFAQSAIDVFKDALAQKLVVMCALEEIVFALEQERSLRDLLKSKFEVAILEKRPWSKSLS